MSLPCNRTRSSRQNVRQRQPVASASLPGVLVPALLGHFSTLPRFNVPTALRGTSASFLVAALLANSLPEAINPVHSAVKILQFAPLAVALLLMSSTGLQHQPRQEHKATLFIPFLVGAVGSLLGATVSAVALAPLCDLQARVALAAVFAATYVGGSLNYVAVGNSLKLSETLLASGIAADMVLMGIYFVGLFWKGSCAIRDDGSGNDELYLCSAIETGRKSGDNSNVKRQFQAVVWRKLARRCLRACLPLCLAATLQLLSKTLASILRQLLLPANSAVELTIISVLAWGVSRVKPGRRFLTDASWLADIALLVFFSALGSCARISSLKQSGPFVFLFGGLSLVTHIFCVWTGSLFWKRIQTKEWLVSSNANIGGPTTAAAYAASLGWRSLVGPAVVVGTLGYLVATPLALALHGVLLHTLPH